MFAIEWLWHKYTRGGFNDLTQFAKQIAGRSDTKISQERAGKPLIG